MTEEYLTDDEQLENVKRVVADNWVWVGGGVLLGAALLFGYRYYDGYRNDRALRAAAQFDDMTSALEQNDPGKVRQIAATLIKSDPQSPYADQAELLLARLAVEEGKAADAIAPLEQVMNGSKDDELKLIARLRLARVLTDQGKADEAIKALSQDSWGAFAARAHEIRGDALIAKQDVQGARAEYRAALEGGSAGSIDAAMLQLKLADLGNTASPSIVSSNKAKP